MKKEKRYYQIRMDYFWLSILAVIIVISIIIAYYASAHEQTSSQPVSTKHRADIDVTFDDLRSSLENTSECYLCGNAEESLMSYFRNFDTIGLISLNDWYVIDFPLKNYDENGNEVESATSTSFLSGNTGEISYSSDGTPSRGMASIDVTLPENYEIDTNMLENHLCQNCLSKVAASLEYRKTDGENKEASLICDFCPSDQGFAYSFLQIPPHDGHPCCSAIHFPLPGHVQDFHLRERAHGAQTKRAPQGAQKTPDPGAYHLCIWRFLIDLYLPVYPIFFFNEAIHTSKFKKYLWTAAMKRCYTDCGLFMLTPGGNTNERTAIYRLF